MKHSPRILFQIKIFMYANITSFQFLSLIPNSINSIFCNHFLIKGRWSRTYSHVSLQAKKTTTKNCSPFSKIAYQKFRSHANDQLVTSLIPCQARNSRVAGKKQRPEWCYLEAKWTRSHKKARTGMKGSWFNKSVPSLSLCFTEQRPGLVRSLWNQCNFFCSAARCVFI